MLGAILATAILGCAPTKRVESIAPKVVLSEGEQRFQAAADSVIFGRTFRSLAELQDELILRGYFLRLIPPLLGEYYIFEHHYAITDSFVYEFEADTYRTLVVTQVSYDGHEAFSYRNMIIENQAMRERVATLKFWRSTEVAACYSPGDIDSETKALEFSGHLVMKAYNRDSIFSETDLEKRMRDTAVYNGRSAHLVHEIVHIKYDTSPVPKEHGGEMAREEATAILAPACLGFESPYLALALVARSIHQDDFLLYKVAGDSLVSQFASLTGMDIYQLGELSEPELREVFWNVEGDNIARLFGRPIDDLKRATAERLAKWGAS